MSLGISTQTPSVSAPPSPQSPASSPGPAAPGPSPDQPKTDAQAPDRYELTSATPAQTLATFSATPQPVNAPSGAPSPTGVTPVGSPRSTASFTETNDAIAVDRGTASAASANAAVDTSQFKTEGTTTLPSGVKVTVNYDPNDPNAQAAAREVLDNAGGDLTKLGQIFGVDPKSLGDWTVNVSNQFGGASHQGGTGPGARTIQMGDATLSQPGATKYGSAGLFVAEAAEVFEAKKGNGWNAGDTNGEGLSRALAIALHPEFGSDPTIGQSSVESGWWNQSNDQYRPNWIDHNSTGDGFGHQGDWNSGSNGQSTLFLFYEHDVLGYSWGQIAQAGGNTLAENYSKLTGTDLKVDPGTHRSQATQNFFDALSKYSDENGNLVIPANGDPFGNPASNYALVPPVAVPLPPAGQ